jgi:hypothetical protein
MNKNNLTFQQIRMVESIAIKKKHQPGSPQTEYDPAGRYPCAATS